MGICKKPQEKSCNQIKKSKKKGTGEKGKKKKGPPKGKRGERKKSIPWKKKGGGGPHDPRPPPLEKFSKNQGLLKTPTREIKQLFKDKEKVPWGKRGATKKGPWQKRENGGKQKG